MKVQTNQIFVAALCGYFTNWKQQYITHGRTVEISKSKSKLNVLAYNLLLIKPLHNCDHKYTTSTYVPEVGDGLLVILVDVADGVDVIAVDDTYMYYYLIILQHLDTTNCINNNKDILKWANMICDNILHYTGDIHRRT